MRHSMGREGFTLVEVLVAVAVFATVIAGVLTVYTSALRARDVANENALIFERFRGYTAFIERDITAAYLSRDRDDTFTLYCDTVPVYHPITDSYVESSRLAFIGLTENEPDNHDLALVSYYLVPDTTAALVSDESSPKFLLVCLRQSQYDSFPMVGQTRQINYVALANIAFPLEWVGTTPVTDYELTSDVTGFSCMPANIRDDGTAGWPRQLEATLWCGYNQGTLGQFWVDTAPDLPWNFPNPDDWNGWAPQTWEPWYPNRPDLGRWRRQSEYKLGGTDRITTWRPVICPPPFLAGWPPTLTNCPRDWDGDGWCDCEGPALPSGYAAEFESVEIGPPELITVVITIEAEENMRRRRPLARDFSSDIYLPLAGGPEAQLNGMR
jgi:prepilin-type N-terminal cleavage/methylation domain-containing protein